MTLTPVVSPACAETCSRPANLVTVSPQDVRTGISQILGGTDRHQLPVRLMGHTTMPILGLREAKEDPWVSRVAKARGNTCTKWMQHVPGSSEECGLGR